MKIAFDVDVLAKQMDINRMVHQVADWGYKYIEQSPHPRINPFYKHPLFSKECEQEYRQALRETGVEISSFIVVYRWSGPTEEQRQFAVANWKRMIQIAGDMGVKVINTELSGDPNQQEICNGMWFKSMEELLPLIEREGIRVEIQSHPYDFCELNNETCDMVKSFRSPNLGYVYSSPVIIWRQLPITRNWIRKEKKTVVLLLIRKIRFVHLVLTSNFNSIWL